jgi:hypothetical protein
MIPIYTASTHKSLLASSKQEAKYRGIWPKMEHSESNASGDFGGT